MTSDAKGIKKMGPCLVLDVCVCVCVRGPVHTAGVWAQWLIPANYISSVSLKYCQMLHSEKECVCVQVVQLGYRQTKVFRHALPQNVCFRRYGGSLVIFFSVLSHTLVLSISLAEGRCICVVYHLGVYEVIYFLRSCVGQALNLFSLAELNLSFPPFMLPAALRSPTSTEYIWISILTRLHTKTLTNRKRSPTVWKRLRASGVLDNKINPDQFLV